MIKYLLILLLVFGSAGIVQCQLCTGSLGDPMVNITFGNTGGPLKPGVTNLIFVFNNCPNDGQYTITNLATGCFNNTWYDIRGDHTGDPGGELMLINASLTPNDFYVDTVSGLCGNTTFEFAAWVTNILRAGVCGGGAKPNITFRIESTTGSLLATYNTGDINVGSSIQWRQYGTFFTTPANVTKVVLRMTNNAVGGCGNDLAIDDITFRPCGPLVSTLLRAQQTDTVSLCLNDPVPLTMDASSSSGLAGYTVQWQLSTDTGGLWTDIAGAMTANYTHQPKNTGVYEYRTLVGQAANFSNPQCRVASTVTAITINPLPVVKAKVFVKGCTGLALTLPGISGTGYSYLWSGPNSFSSIVQSPVIPNAVYADSGLYKVTVKTDLGCSNTDSVQVNMVAGVKAVVSTPSPFCEGSSALLTASGAVSYQWTPVTGLSNPAVSNPIASPTVTTTYQVVADALNGCKDSAQTTVVVYPVPHITAGPDKQLFEGESITLEGSISGAYSNYYWSPTTAMTNVNTLSPTVSPTDSISYTLYATPANACPAVSDQAFVRVYKKLSIPNAFSPNGDGMNDTWRIKGLETYPDAVITVFDRKGMPVFKTTDVRFQWDGMYRGRALPIDTYYYVVDVHMPRIGLLSGWVVILR